MHKDPNLRKRDALVIPGGLLAAFSLIGLLYVTFLRSDATTCDSGSQIVFAGACRSAALLLAIPLIIGLAMVGAGALAFRSKATCRHGHGSWTHFGLALLIAWVVIPAIGFMAAPSLVGPDSSIERGGVSYPVATILAGLSGVGVLMLVPFAILYAAQVRANPCCTEKGCFTPCFCDEPAAPEGEVPQEAVAEPMGAPAQEWNTVPEAPPMTPAPEPQAVPAGEWEVVEPATAEAPAVLAPTAAAPWSSSAPAAPELYVRPSDPAAPPADEMATAAKWAEEDEQALEELEGTPSKRRRALRKAPAKKDSGKSSKKK